MPNFEIAYTKLEACSNTWWVDIRLNNTGGLAFESLSVTVKDATTNRDVSMSSDVFRNMDGCVEKSLNDVLQPGTARVISTPAFAYNLNDHTLRVIDQVCSGEGQNGLCIKKSIKFTPHGED